MAKRRGGIPGLADLRAEIEAAKQEFEMAVQFHEVWKPAAYDGDLHKRMSKSYAGNAFLMVRDALRREMLLALIRLWDKVPGSVRMDSIAESLRNKDIINALAADKAAHIGHEAEVQIRKELGQWACAAVALIAKYSKDGSHGAVRDNLKKLRDKRLAHRQIEEAVIGPDADGEIESFYQDTSELVRLLLSLVGAFVYDPQEAAQVYRHYATLFWAGLRGEQTEGHPNYRARPRG